MRGTQVFSCTIFTLGGGLWWIPPDSELFNQQGRNQWWISSEITSISAGFCTNFCCWFLYASLVEGNTCWLNRFIWVNILRFFSLSQRLYNPSHIFLISSQTWSAPTSWPFSKIGVLKSTFNDHSTTKKSFQSKKGRHQDIKKPSKNHQKPSKNIRKKTLLFQPFQPSYHQTSFCVAHYPFNIISNRYTSIVKTMEQIIIKPLSLW